MILLQDMLHKTQYSINFYTTTSCTKSSVIYNEVLSIVIKDSKIYYVTI